MQVVLIDLIYYKEKDYMLLLKDASNILGLEVSGKNKKNWKKVKNLKINQKVCALVHGGGYRIL